MLLELLIIIFLLWIYSGSFNIVSPEIQPSSNRLLEEINRDAHAILRGLNLSPNYTIIESKERTYVTNKEIIHLLIRCPHTQRIYSRETLLVVTLHEIAHVLCHEEGHSPLFYEIEEELMREAIKQGYIERDYIPDIDYPCQ